MAATLRDLLLLSVLAVGGTALVGVGCYRAGGFAVVLLGEFAWGIVLASLAVALGDASWRRWAREQPEDPTIRDERRYWGGR